MKVPYVNLGIQNKPIKEELLSEIEKVLDSGMYILGDAVNNFEDSFAKLCGTKHAISVGNGTDAITLTLKALGITCGDEVITAPNSFLASASGIYLAGATPVFADINENLNISPTEIEKIITDKTKAILPVHLTGNPADMDAINTIANKYNLFVIEDAAQAVNAEYKGNKVGALGTAGCFSLHPLKNLNAAGDAGIITTNDDIVAEYLKKARNHGLKNRDECEFWSPNSRTDALQAALLNVKIKHLDEWTERRINIANYYSEELSSLVTIPEVNPETIAVFHAYVIQTDERDNLQQYLYGRGIDTKIHYPIPIHLQEAAKDLGYKKGDFPVTERAVTRILSLPVFPELEDKQVEYVAESIKNYFKV